MEGERKCSDEQMKQRKPNAKTSCGINEFFLRHTQGERLDKEAHGATAAVLTKWGQEKAEKPHAALQVTELVWRCEGEGVRDRNV